MQTLLRLWRTLEACPWHGAVAAEWEERFGADVAALRPHLKATKALAETYPCPSGGGEGCPRQVHDRGGGVFDAVCGNVPADCAPVRLKKTQLAVLALDRHAALVPLLAAVHEQEFLESVTLEASDGLLPLGLLVRRAGRVLVVLASSEAAQLRGAVLELQRRAGADAVALIVDGAKEPHVEERIAVLPLDDPRDLRLWRALKLLWPESWAKRGALKEALFEDVTLEFACTAERHIVRLNGEELKDFRTSDTKFARLLRLAAARSTDRDAENGGWLKKSPALQLDEKESDLGDLRKAFLADQPDGFAGMTEAERKALLQSSADKPGLLRLPLQPRHIRFDESLRNLRLLGDKQTEPRSPSKKAARKATSGSAELARNQTQAKAKALKMLGEARKLGVPLPIDSELRGS
jgi:hypothetical protein